MSANIFVYLFCLLMAGLLYYFRLRHVKTHGEYRRLVWVVAAIIFFLLVNAVFAYFGWRGVKMLVDLQPVTTLQRVSELENQDAIILLGTVSEANEVQRENYAAYVECDDDSCFPQLPMDLWIALPDGVISISNDDYGRRNWEIEYSTISYTYEYLPVGQEVVIVANVVDLVTIAGENKGDVERALDAQIVYAGAYDDFRFEAQFRSMWPQFLLLLNLVTVVIFAGVAYAYYIPKEEGEELPPENGGAEA